ncbi:MAG: Mbov_0395 family pilin-like conjugal transfer protein [Parcubacteria group bacterium]
MISIFSFSTVKSADVSDAFNETSSSVLSQTAEGAGFFQNDTNDINSLIQTIINVVLSFLGVIFTIIIIYAGFKWMTAQGNPEEVNQAKGLLKNAIIGLLIVLAAYAISVAIFSFLINTNSTLEYNQ